MTSSTTSATSSLGMSILGRWAVPALWATLPLTAGSAFADALEPTSTSFRAVAVVGLWVLWLAGLILSLVPRTTSLTGVRVIVPASLPAAAWAAIAAPTLGVAQVIAIASTGAATILVLSAPVGEVFVNGSAYGDERRFPLKPPASLLIGPLELAWAACVVGAVTGPLLLGAQAYVAGAVLTAAGWPLAWACARALHGLSQRWVVFVPAGFVLHDRMALTDPVLFPRRMVAAVGPAPVDTSATDCSLGALGLVLQVDLTEPTTVAPVPPRTRPGQRPALESIEVSSLLFSPSHPGAVLREARSRRLPVA